MENTQRVDVAIIGGGFAGTMVAANLLAAPGLRRIALVARETPVGRGVAYGTPVTTHLLNIPAGEMSAWADDPEHFTRWLQARDPEAHAGTYAPRGLYGTYVQEVLEATIARSPSGPGFQLIAEEAIGLLPEDGRYRLRLASGALLTADRVVLAIGQFPPAPLRVSAEAQAPWRVEDPWSEAALAPMPGGTALVVGTGLTGVDLAIALIDQAGAARVRMISRRAILPWPQYEGPAYPAWLQAASAPTRVSALVRLVRSEVAQARAAGLDWRAVIDALKPELSPLWARLPLVERRRFLRHVRTYWEAARNRLPPPTARRLEALRAEGRLEVASARLRVVSGGPEGAIATLATRRGECTLRIDRLVNCTGPDTLYRRINHPLVLDLIGTGLARPDPLGLGLDTASDGRLKDEDGLAERPLYTLGWPRQGQLWEATTVPSLREQARDVARRVLGT